MHPLDKEKAPLRVLTAQVFLRATLFRDSTFYVLIKWPCLETALFYIPKA
jgi:hypothetical protein